MRVAHVITRLIVGGAQENTVASVLGLASRPPWDLELVSGPTQGREGSLESAFRTHPGMLRIEPHLVRPIHPWKDLLAAHALWRHFRSTRPGIVHTHSGKAGLLGRLAARRAGVPLVIHTIHGPSFGPFQGNLSNLLFTQAERIAGEVTDHFVVVAHAMRDQYLDAGIGRPEDYTRVLSGFDLDPFLHAVRDEALAVRLGLRPDDFVVGMIARLFKLKGHEELFGAADELVRRIPNIRFLLVGDGDWRDRFEEWASRPGLAGRFVFTGLLPPSEVPRHVALMNGLVHLSRREGLPRALPQAAAAGLPIVAYDVDGAGEVCRNGENGFLLRLGDQSGLVEALVRLASDPSLARTMGENGRRSVRELFPVERMVDELDSLYRRLLDQKGRPVA